MTYTELNSNEYLITGSHFEAAQHEWRISSDVPMILTVSVAGGLIIATKEREMWYLDSDGKSTVLWIIRFYVRGDENPFFWFSKNGDKIGDLEIQHLNNNLIRRIGEIEWKEVGWSTLEK